MRIEVLTVADCPNRIHVLARLHEALNQIHTEPVDIEERVIDTPAAAASAGMHGSPTVLVNGHDPFADDTTVASLSCRLYPSSTGFDGAPSVDALADVLRGLR
jgi:hypothetical protein